MNCLQSTFHAFRSSLDTVRPIVVHSMEQTISSIENACFNVSSTLSRGVCKIRSGTHDAIAYIKPPLARAAHRIETIAIFIFTRIAPVCLGLAYNSSLFMIGAFVAIMPSSHMDSAINRVMSVWHAQHKFGKSLIVAACLTAWPITFGLYSFFIGSAVTLWLLRLAEESKSSSSVDGTHEKPLATAK